MSSKSPLIVKSFRGGRVSELFERRETGHESSVPKQDATKRLALVNCEWQQIRAVDILTILRSFCPASGEVKRVTVYPSDFGLQRMKEENASSDGRCGEN